MKNKVGNGMNKLFNFRGQIINVSYRDIFALTYEVLHDKEWKNNNRIPIVSRSNTNSMFLILNGDGLPPKI